MKPALKMAFVALNKYYGNSVTVLKILSNSPLFGTLAFQDGFEYRNSDLRLII